MKVEIGPEWTDFGFSLVYREAEHSFNAVPRPVGGITSVLLNDLQLEIDDEGTVVYVWGLFPLASECASTALSPPDAKRQRLRFISSDGWTPGVSVRLNKDTWNVFANELTGWVGVGNPNASMNHSAVEFAPNSIAILDNRSIVALWLKPV